MREAPGSALDEELDALEGESTGFESDTGDGSVSLLSDVSNLDDERLDDPQSDGDDDDDEDGRDDDGDDVGGDAPMRHGNSRREKMFDVESYLQGILWNVQVSFVFCPSVAVSVSVCVSVFVSVSMMVSMSVSACVSVLNCSSLCCSARVSLFALHSRFWNVQVSLLLCG